MKCFFIFFLFIYFFFCFVFLVVGWGGGKAVGALNHQCQGDCLGPSNSPRNLGFIVSWDPKCHLLPHHFWQLSSNKPLNSVFSIGPSDPTRCQFNFSTGILSKTNLSLCPHLHCIIGLSAHPVSSRILSVLSLRSECPPLFSYTYPPFGNSF